MLLPLKQENLTLYAGFMFETAYQLATTEWAIKESGKVQQDYWKGEDFGGAYLPCGVHD